MIRLIVRHDDAHMAGNVGGAVLTRFQTFDVELPELEAVLSGGGASETAFAHSQLIGCEIIPKAEPSHG